MSHALADVHSQCIFVRPCILAVPEHTHESTGWTCIVDTRREGIRGRSSAQGIRSCEEVDENGNDPKNYTSGQDQNERKSRIK